MSEDRQVPVVAKDGTIITHVSAKRYDNAAAPYTNEDIERDAVLVTLKPGQCLKVKA